MSVTNNNRGTLSGIIDVLHTSINNLSVVGTLTLQPNSPPTHFLNPTADRTVLLPAEADSAGLMFFLINDAADGAGFELAVKEDAGSTTIANLGGGEAGIFVCDGTTWVGNVFPGGASTLGIDGTDVGNVADDNIIGGIPVVHRIAIAAGALAETDVVLTHKTRVTDVVITMSGAGVSNCTAKIQNGSTTITDAMDVNNADKTVIRALTLDNAQQEIAAGGTLRVKTETGATQPAFEVLVYGIRVA